jgi:hypothetical protein
MCVNEDGCCISVNYKKNSLYDEKENCELLHVTSAEEPGLLEVHIDYDHYVLLQPNRVSDKLPRDKLPHGPHCNVPAMLKKSCNVAKSINYF